MRVSHGAASLLPSRQLGPAQAHGPVRMRHPPFAAASAPRGYPFTASYNESMTRQAAAAPPRSSAPAAWPVHAITPQPVLAARFAMHRWRLGTVETVAATAGGGCGGGPAMAQVRRNTTFHPASHHLHPIRRRQHQTESGVSSSKWRLLVARACSSSSNSSANVGRAGGSSNRGGSSRGVGDGGVSVFRAAVGIDLGTTTSAVAVVGRDGRPVLVEDEAGRAVIPSVVFVRQDGTVLVGAEAAAAAESDPANAFYGIKRLMGRTYREALQERYDDDDEDGGGDDDDDNVAQAWPSMAATQRKAEVAAAVAAAAAAAATAGSTAAAASTAAVASAAAAATEEGEEEGEEEGGPDELLRNQGGGTKGSMTGGGGLRGRRRRFRSYSLLEGPGGSVELACPALGRNVTPEDVSSHILRHLVARAEAFLKRQQQQQQQQQQQGRQERQQQQWRTEREQGQRQLEVRGEEGLAAANWGGGGGGGEGNSHQPIGARAQQQRQVQVLDAVITVPAHFGPAQRRAVSEAARAVGLDRVTLLQEPIAAAMAYGFGSPQVPYDVLLVFDLGGGTLDLTVVEAFEGIMEVLSTSGDDYLGGDDFTAAVAEWLALKLQDQETQVQQLTNPSTNTHTDADTNTAKITAAAIAAANTDINAVNAVDVSLTAAAKADATSTITTNSHSWPRPISYPTEATPYPTEATSTSASASASLALHRAAEAAKLALSEAVAAARTSSRNGSSSSSSGSSNLSVRVRLPVFPGSGGGCSNAGGGPEAGFLEGNGRGGGTAGFPCTRPLPLRPPQQQQQQLEAELSLETFEELVRPLLRRMWWPLEELALATRTQLGGRLPPYLDPRASKSRKSGSRSKTRSSLNSSSSWDVEGPGRREGAAKWTFSIFPPPAAGDGEVDGTTSTAAAAAAAKYVAPPRRLTGLVLVGAGTRLPVVRDYITEVTGLSVRPEVDPETAVALGAALHAGLMVGAVTGGIEMGDGSYVSDQHGRASGFQVAASSLDGGSGGGGGGGSSAAAHNDDLELIWEP